jgi:predicted RND superfamily exporter protein
VAPLRAGPHSSTQSKYAEWICVALGAISVFVVLSWIDLSPEVESEFFFSREDPQLVALQEMDRRFPSPQQVIVRAAAPDITSDSYLSEIRELTAALDEIPAVTSVSSVTTDDAANSPLWSRLLLNPGGSSTNLIVQVPDPDPTELVPQIEGAIQPFMKDDLDIVVSGVPYIVELIRRNLFRDLVVFSAAAFLVFGTLVGLVYRNRHIVVGTLTTCLLGCAVTLSLAHLLDIGIGLLTANIAVIVFVLTLSHIVFLTSNWKGIVEENGGSGLDPVADSISLTFGASFWSMATTVLGFLSLLVASAKPLRELGIAGAIGTVTAITIAYGIYPTFLRGTSAVAANAPPDRKRADFGALLPTRHGAWWLLAIGIITVVAAIGLPQLNTDPSLLSYFATGSDLRNGLEAIDRDGGSSPLNVAVTDPDGSPIDSDRMNEKMWALQERFENDSSVGVTISPALLLAHARLAPFGSFMSWSQLMDILESSFANRAGRSFVTPDREQGRYFLRMRESGRTETRSQVVNRVRDHVTESDLQVTLLAGHYELQGQLGKLIASSLRIGLGGLLLLFVGIAFITSRSGRRTAAMVVCLCGIPSIVLGTAAHLGMPIDIITSPAANVALAMGVDSMIHLVMRVRRLANPSLPEWETWLRARNQLWRPIVGATFIICAGFGIFSLSTFPPTQRFGLAVILGTLTAATMALVALPFAATVKIKKDENAAPAVG